MCFLPAFVVGLADPLGFYCAEGQQAKAQDGCLQSLVIFHGGFSWGMCPPIDARLANAFRYGIELIDSVTAYLDRQFQGLDRCVRSAAVLVCRRLSKPQNGFVLNLPRWS